MRIRILTNFVWLMILILSGCNEDKKDPLLEEAHAFHQESNRVRSQIQEKLQAIEGLSSESVNDIRKSIQEWDENMVEVPGYEEDHDGHDHDHDHAHHHHHPAPNLTSRQHLELQRSLLDEIRNIQNKLVFVAT